LGEALMTFRPLAIILVSLLLLPTNGYAEEHFPGTTWDHLPAESGGWSAATLAKAQAWSKLIGSTAVMIVQHGLVVAEWGDTAAKTPLASVRKSLLSALIGIAVERHQIALNATLGDLGIDDNAPSLNAEEKTATVRDLLEARSGVYHPALCETPDMAEQRPARFSHKPGAFWHYNNWDFDALGSIYEHATGSSIYDAFQREIARPIGMEDYQPWDGKYVTGAASVCACYTFAMSARDLARFALLYLNDGRWNDRQIVPAQWVKDSTQPYSQSGSGPGYGYLWWTGFLDSNIVPSVQLPPGTFFAAGYGGQFAFVIPADDLIVVNRDAHYPEPGPGLREIGRLLWLVLDAGGFQDIGPDASIEAAHGKPEDGAALSRLLSGETLVYGTPAIGGPFRMRLGRDGSTAVFGGDSVAPIDTGTWNIADNKFCRDWQKISPHHACFTAIQDGSKVQLFDRNGLMFTNARMAKD
jgi:CubicO group peptidase (beta-lactamase class C family)